MLFLVAIAIFVGILVLWSAGAIPAYVDYQIRLRSWLEWRILGYRDREEEADPDVLLHDYGSGDHAFGTDHRARKDAARRGVREEERDY